MWKTHADLAKIQHLAKTQSLVKKRGICQNHGIIFPGCLTILTDTFILIYAHTCKHTSSYVHAYTYIRTLSKAYTLTIDKRKYYLFC